MGVAGASAASAAAQAAAPVNSVNDATAWPAAEHYPGAVTSAQYGTGSYAPPGGVAGPVATAQAPNPFPELAPGVIEGGGYGDTAWTTGHDGPQAPWDSSAGAPFAPSGALDPDLHGTDTGGVFVREHVIPAGIGSLTRRVQSGQTMDRLGSTQQVIGQMAPNNRQDLGQYQVWDPEGHAPWDIPYSERPIYNNVAYQPVASTDPGNAYGVAGALPDRSPYSYAAQAYQAPPDPDVAAPAASSAPAGFAGAGWLAG